MNELARLYLEYCIQFCYTSLKKKTKPEKSLWAIRIVREQMFHPGTCVLSYIAKLELRMD